MVDKLFVQKWLLARAYNSLLQTRSQALSWISSVRHEKRGKFWNVCDLLLWMATIGFHPCETSSAAHRQPPFDTKGPYILSTRRLVSGF